MKRSLLFGLFFIALNLVFALPASAWWNQNWTKRVKLTFLNGGQAENLANFPVLVRIDNTRLSYADTQNAGQDIRFVDSEDTTPLTYEIETWNEAGSSYIWDRAHHRGRWSALLRCRHRRWGSVADRAP